MGDGGRAHHVACLVLSTCLVQVTPEIAHHLVVVAGQLEAHHAAGTGHLPADQTARILSLQSGIAGGPDARFFRQALRQEFRRRLCALDAERQRRQAAVAVRDLPPVGTFFNRIMSRFPESPPATPKGTPLAGVPVVD